MCVFHDLSFLFQLIKRRKTLKCSVCITASVKILKTMKYTRSIIRTQRIYLQILINKVKLYKRKQYLLIKIIYRFNQPRPCLS